MNITQIETKLKDLIEYFNQFEFIYSLLEAYNFPKATIAKLKKGNLNFSKNPGELILRKKLFFKEEFMFDLHETIIAIKDHTKYNERFIIVTDYKTFLAIDTVTQDKLDIQLSDLPKYYDFFLPWAGMEKTTHANENPADVKAAERMAKLFDEIKKENPDNSPEFVHSLNVFLSRLLFCFFAEDTNIFKEGQFTNTLDSHTAHDGSDLDSYLNSLFEVLNTPDDKRRGLPNFLQDFPYVNGGLFKDKITLPKFNRKSRQAIIDSGEMIWSAINPDIFGSMFQAVISVDQRGTLGQHYTSVPNIMKVIEPLFLNDLREEFEKAKGNVKKLNELAKRIQNIKVFDPACGSGNFLIIAYKELRKLEIDIFAEIDETQGTYSNQYSLITLNNFFGIELDDFAHEIAKLALWLAEHQMNLEFFKALGKTNPTLPLKDAGQIKLGNATRIEWNEVCNPSDDGELYLIGNPPYRGKKEQTSEQKEDLKFCFRGINNFKNLDFISCWFYKASNFIRNNKTKAAFVSTNSICQGEQIGLLWPHIYENEIEIFFAYKSFVWKNNAKKNAGVAVVIIGLQSKRPGEKELYLTEGKTLKKLITDKINPYLSTGSDTLVIKRSKPLSVLPSICNGSMPNDDGNFFFNQEEYDKSNEDIKKYIRNVIGAKEFFHGINRYCLWLDENNFKEASRIPRIKKIIEDVQEYRLNSPREATKILASVPYRFGEARYEDGPSIIVPGLSAEKREYIPIGFLNGGTIVTNLAQVVYRAEPWVYGVISSKMNNIWVRATSGYFKKDIRYSPILSYNTFPFPTISKQRKEELERSVFRILDEREKYSDKTLAELYAPGKMPEGLKLAHQLNDEAVERCYRVTPFNSDEERLEYLFRLYEKMIMEEQNSKTLFQKQKKTTKKN